MAQIKETIEHLCRILQSNCTVKIKPETFRLAKFDTDECVEIWWRLLLDLIHFSTNGCIDSTEDGASSKLSLAEITDYVKNKIQTLGLMSPEFTALPADMSHGSRELLLVFAWFLRHESVIERFMSCPSAISRQSLYSHSNNENKKCDEMACQRLLIPVDFSPHSDPVTNVKQLLLFNGKLDHSLRGLHALQRQRSKLHHRVATSTYGVRIVKDHDHLSPSDVYLLRHPQSLIGTIVALEKDNERLQNLLDWKKHEETFWNWMCTVLELNNKPDASDDNPQNCATSLDDAQGCVPVIGIDGSLMIDMQSAQRQLHEMIINYESIIEKLEDMWHDKRASITEADLDTLLTSINAELSVQKSRLASESRSHTSVKIRHSEPHFWYYKTDPKRQTTNMTKNDFKMSNEKSHKIHKKFTKQAENMDFSDSVDILQEISQLKKLVDELEGRLSTKQESFRTELHELADNVQDTVCIAPMAVKSVTL